MSSTLTKKKQNPGWTRNLLLFSPNPRARWVSTLSTLESIAIFVGFLLDSCGISKVFPWCFYDMSGGFLLPFFHPNSWWFTIGHPRSFDRHVGSPGVWHWQIFEAVVRRDHLKHLSPANFDKANLRHTLWWTYKKQWKITIFNGKIHYKWPFSIAMLVHQRVRNSKPTYNVGRGPLLL